MRTRRPALAMAGIALVASACGGGGASAEEFCDDAEALQDRFADLGEMDMSTDGPQAFAQVRQALDDVTPPDEIADDYNTVKDAVARIAEVFENFDPQNPDPDAIQEIAGLQEEFQDVETAAANVESYVRDECGIELDSDGDAPSEAPTEE